MEEHFCAGKLTLPARIEAAAGNLPSKRLRILDRRSGTWFLIDTGADVSVLPKNKFNNNKALACKLFAANGSTINTYGSLNHNLDLGLRRSFPWTFTVADVCQSILGADFVHHYGLTINLNQKTISDPITQLQSVLAPTRVIEAPVYTINQTCRFADIIKQYPELTNGSPRPISNYSVQHHIITNGHPISEKPRRLAGENCRPLVRNSSSC